MMKKIIYFTYFNLYFLSHSAAQQWLPLGSGMPDGPFQWDIRTLFADTSNKLMYAGGDFNYADSIQGYGIAVWNGTKWDSLGSGCKGPVGTSGTYGTVNAITWYKGYIYAGGNFGLIGGIPVGEPSIARWNGTTWDSIPGTPNDGVQELYFFEDTLYVMGWTANSIGFESRIFKYDGVNWHTFPVLDSNKTFGYIGTATFYKGELYVGGNFLGTEGPGLQDIARFDNNTKTWKSVGGGTTCDCWVNKLYVWNDTLYVAGYFQQLGGTSFNNIAAWDGNNWSDVGGGTIPANVADIIGFDSYLYAIGQINFAGSIPVNRMAKWDGSQWYDGDVGDPTVQGSCLAVLNNELYMGGYFKTINGDTMNNIAKFSPLPVTVKKEWNQKKSGFEIYPNPAVNSVYIRKNNPGSTNIKIEIYNTLGQKVYSSQLNVTYGTSVETLYLNGLSKGMYLIKINDGVDTHVNFHRIVLY